MESVQRCQSCGMPFDAEHKQLIAKEQNGADSPYCTYCYGNGTFRNPDTTVEEMIALAVSHYKCKTGDEEAARVHMTNVISGLSRWKKFE